MTTAPSAEDCARRLLDIFKGKHLRVADVLPLGHVGTAFLRDGFRTTDFRAGAEFAGQQGWLEFDGNLVRLTENGFAEM